MRILLVDDDEALMESLATRLIHQRYAVDIAVTGGSAESFMDLFHYDLVVLDLMLPDGDGIEFCKQFRSAGYANPLMILTAKESTAQKVSALDAGADDYVVKPFDFDELCARIRALLRRDAQGLPAVLQWGPLALDPSTYETTFAGQLVRLTPKEFSMMELFLRHPHRVYSLSSIIDDLWSFEDPPGEDAIRTHIKGLRRKLQAAGAPKDLIKTVYGLGYRLNEQIVWDESEAPWALSEKLAQACDRYLHAASQQIDSLEVTVEAWMRGTLTPDIKALGQLNAHKLAGSLGSFGMPEGSRIARELEAHLKALVLSEPAPDSAPGSACGSVSDSVVSGFGPVCSSISPGAIAQLVEQLRLQVATPPQPAQNSTTMASTGPGEMETAAARPADLPVLLLVSKDEMLCQQLMAWAQRLLTVQLRVVSGAKAAIQLFDFAADARVLNEGCSKAGGEAGGEEGSEALSEQQCERALPDVLMIDLERCPVAYAALLAHVHEERGPWCHDVPVMALAGASGVDLAGRLALMDQGVALVGDRAAPPLTLIQTALSLLPPKTHRIQVAIVDDDAQRLALLKRNLAPWGFSIYPFDSAEACWQWMSKAPASPAMGKDAGGENINNKGRRGTINKGAINRGPDILVLNIESPETTGLELCRVVRGDVRFQLLPILFLTVPQDPALRVQAFQSGADEVMDKSVAVAELAKRLHTQFARACRLAVGCSRPTHQGTQSPEIPWIETQFTQLQSPGTCAKPNWADSSPGLLRR